MNSVCARLLKLVSLRAFKKIYKKRSHGILTTLSTLRFRFNGLRLVSLFMKNSYVNMFLFGGVLRRRVSTFYVLEIIVSKQTCKSSARILIAGSKGGVRLHT